MKSITRVARSPRMRVFLVALAACAPARSDPAQRAPATVRDAGVTLAHAPASPARVGDPGAAGTVIAARVVASIDGAPASDRPAYARADQKVTLFAVVEVQAGHAHAWFSDAPAVRLAGRTLHPLPLARGPAIALAWYRIEPAVASMSNTDADGGNFQFRPIDYRATAIPEAAGRGAWPANVRPTLTPDHGHGVGTMRFQVAVAQGARAVASPGIEARRGRGSGGLTDAVMRVSIRRDDSYLGYLTELYGQPYIWASAGTSDATHQAERLEGADCADFVVYGQRRLGKRVAYTWTGGLPALTRRIAAGARGADGIYRDAAGRPLPFTRAGDLVLFPRHVGVLAEDRGTPGVLDDRDVIMHALLDTPKEVPLADSGYADEPIELRRFR